MAPNRPNAGSPAQRLYYLTVLLPMWRGQLERLAAAQRDYRRHLLAAECLRRARGPGADPLRLAEFCRAWQVPLTAPVIGPVALLRKAAKAVGGWPSAGAVFDPTGAISIGVKLLGQMAPLLGQIQMRNALLEALNEQVIPKADQSDVLSIINRSGSPHFLMSRLSESKDTLERVWRETIDFAGRMQAAQKDLGLPDSAL